MHVAGAFFYVMFFQEYTPELKPISKKELKTSDGIVLVGQKPAVISPPITNVSAPVAANAHSPVMQKASETANASSANAVASSAAK